MVIASVVRVDNFHSYSVRKIIEKNHWEKSQTNLGYETLRLRIGIIGLGQNQEEYYRKVAS